MWSSKEVRALRDVLAITQEEFAHKLGVCLGTVQAWEQKRKKPSKLARRQLDQMAKKSVK